MTTCKQHMCPAEDFTYLPFFIIYQYYFAMLKLYALFTLHVTAWGTRAGVGAPNAKDTVHEVDDVQVRCAMHNALLSCAQATATTPC